MTTISESKKAWWVTTNSDLTEGRGKMVHIAFCEAEATARRVAHKKGVQGSNACVNLTNVYRINGRLYGPILVEGPSREDIKLQERIDSRNAAIKKAKDLGMTDEEIALLR